MKFKSIFLILLLTLTSRAWSQNYTIDLEAGGEQIAEIGLRIDGGMAVANVGDVTERFNLKNQSWENADAQWVTLAQCEKWAELSKKKSAASAASVPEHIRPFVVWSLNPTFKVEASDTTLKMTSEQVDYVVTGKTTDRDLTDYYLYAKLNAYKKAMTERKLPPFAELQVLKELERRKMMPTSMEITIPGIKGAPKITMTIEEKS